MCRGLAPDAKVEFIDLASGTTGGIYTPQDLSENYYPFSYGVGARVHSDSWGSGAAAQDYDFMASEVDMFTWENQVPAFFHICAAQAIHACPPHHEGLAARGGVMYKMKVNMKASCLSNRVCMDARGDFVVQRGLISVTSVQGRVKAALFTTRIKVLFRYGPKLTWWRRILRRCLRRGMRDLRAAGRGAAG